MAITSFSIGNFATPAPPPGSPLRRLLDAPMRPGLVHWIAARPARHAPMAVIADAELELGAGLVGDHYGGRSGSRQVSLIGVENLAAIGGFLGTGPADPAMLRRNFVIGGINLLALKGRCFRLGTAILAYAGDCHPCSRMETLLGVGGYNAVRGQGGILARVLQAGRVEIGGALSRLDDEPAQAILPL